MSLPSRKLVTILAADVVGYSSLIAEDEARTLDALRALRRELLEPVVAEHGGDVIKRMGDGWLVSFASVVDAAQCAIEVQDGLAGHDRAPLRIGIHLGDIVHEDEDVYGDGVNIAARLQEIAAPGGVVLSGLTYECLIGRLDSRFEDIGEQSLKNIARSVRAWRWINSANTDAGAGKIHVAAPVLPDKPSIVVLPFVNMSSDPDQEFFCDGMTEDVTMALSRFRQLFVVAQKSALIYKSRQVDIAEVSRALGVRYVLEGSVRKAGNRLRVTAQLVDAVGNRHVWAEKYDGSVEEIFDFQDRLTTSIASSAAPEVGLAEQERHRRRPTSDLTVWNLLARARQTILTPTADNMLHAIELAKQAIMVDPECSDAFSFIATCHGYEAMYGWNRPISETFAAQEIAVNKAISLDRRNENALIARGSSLLRQKQHKEAQQVLVRALEVNPNSAAALGTLGAALIWDRQREQGVEKVVEALRRSPNEQGAAFHHVNLGVANYFSGDYEACIVHCDNGHSEFPSLPTPVRLKLSALGWLGRKAEAKAVLAKLNELLPGVTIEKTRPAVISAYEEDVETFLEGLRRASMPE